MEGILPKARQSGLVVQEVDGDTVVYDTDRHQASSLNRLASSVWKQCDGATPPAEIARRISTSNEPVTDDAVWHALYQLGDVHLLDDAPARLERLAPVTRRELMTTLTRAGLAIPLVTAVAAPAAAQAGSQPPDDD